MRRDPGAVRLCVVCCVLAVGVCGVVTAQPPSGGEVDKAGRIVRETIDAPKLTPRQRRRTDQLVRDLGSDLWRRREDATKELIRMGPVAGAVVKSALSGSDAEARVRAEHVLAEYRRIRRDWSYALGRALGVLAGAGQKWIVGAMLQLLDHADTGVRYTAQHGLCRWTAQQFGYDCDADRTARDGAAARWRTWWKGARGTFTLPDLGGPGGLLLCCDEHVRLITLAGKEVWSKRMVGRVYAAQLLGNGNLIAVVQATEPDGKDTWVLSERGADEKVVWTNRAVVCTSMTDFQRLANGRTLISDYTDQRIVEVDRGGAKVVWQCAIQAKPRSIRRLTNGNTLILGRVPGNRDQVSEIDRRGRTVWAVGGMYNPKQVTNAPNGNALVAEMCRRRVLEFDRSGGLVAVLPMEAGYPIGACRLANGETIVAKMRGGLVVVGRQGRVARKLGDIKRPARGMRATTIPRKLPRGSRKGE